jgi:hypothetical protein
MDYAIANSENIIAPQSPSMALAEDAGGIKQPQMYTDETDQARKQIREPAPVH